MEFGFEPVCDQIRAISTCRDSSNLVSDRFAAGLSQIPLRYPGRRQVRGWSQTCRRRASSLDDRPNSCSSLHVCDQDSVMEFGSKLTERRRSDSDRSRDSSANSIVGKWVS